MLQQTVIKAVLPVYTRFLDEFPTLQSLAKAETEQVRLAVRGLGYYRRFDLMHKAAQKILGTGNGAWPETYEDWKALPGIGDYTASAITSIVFDAPHGVVDGNVERVMCRLFDIRSAPNLPHLKVQFKSLMDQLASIGSAGALNQSVMELGQTCCTPTNPSCEKCPVSRHCLSKRRNSQTLAPGPKIKIEKKAVQLALIVAHQLDKKIGLTRRPLGAKFLKATLGFPTLICGKNNKWQGDGFDAPAWMIEAAVKMTAQKGAQKTYRHHITSHNITIRVIPHTLNESHPFDMFVPMESTEEVLVSNLDRKALRIRQ